MTSILVVSEDPFFLDAVHGDLTALGGRVTGCMGPAQSVCELLEHGYCPLADHADVVIVDTPATGAFARGRVSIPAGTYAQRLAERHPCSLVLLSGAREGAVGATGEAVPVADRDAALSAARYAVMAGTIDLVEAPTA
jgi:hypothetical protein